MNKIISIILILSLFTQCKNDKNTDVSVKHNIDTLIVKKSIKWINESLGIENGFEIIDTITRKDDPIFAYGTHLVLPKLVSKSGEFKTLNNKILADFKPILDEVKSNPKANENEYQKVFYDYFLKDSIITLKITHQVAYYQSEGTMQFAIYHYDYKNDKLLNTSDMFAVFGLSQVPVLNAVAMRCTFPPDYTEPLFDTKWFETVKWKDINQLKFYVNNQGELYVIYPLAEGGGEAEQLME